MKISSTNVGIQITKKKGVGTTTKEYTGNGLSLIIQKKDNLFSSVLTP